MAKRGEIIWKAHKHFETGATNDSFEPAYKDKYLALRTDGWLLTKLVVGRYSMFDTNKIERHDYGWKRYGKAKPEIDSLEKARAIFEPKGWIVSL